MKREVILLVNAGTCEFNRGACILLLPLNFFPFLLLTKIDEGLWSMFGIAINMNILVDLRSIAADCGTEQSNTEKEIKWRCKTKPKSLMFWSFHSQVGSTLEVIHKCNRPGHNIKGAQKKCFSDFIFFYFFFKLIIYWALKKFLSVKNFFFFF